MGGYINEQDVKMSRRFTAIQFFISFIEKLHNNAVSRTAHIIVLWPR